MSRVVVNATHKCETRTLTLCGVLVISNQNPHIKLKVETSREQLVRTFDYETD